MDKVFISGSIKIKKLDNNILDKIDSIMESKLHIMLGDADGVDSSIQGYLLSKEYKKVTIYCTGDNARNNLGSWNVQNISTNKKSGSRAYYTAKDLKLAEDCNYGLMVWDTRSSGTLNNVIELLTMKKKSVVYINRDKKFYLIKNIDDLKILMDLMHETSRVKIEKKINIKSKIENILDNQNMLFDL